MTRVLLAYDGSAGARLAADLVEWNAWPSGSILRVVTVLEPTPLSIVEPWAGGAAMAPEIEAAMATNADHDVAEAVDRLAAPQRTVEGAVLYGRPATTIVEDARQFRADLLVVGSRGRGPIASLLLGSVSTEVVDHAPCPVLVARTGQLSQVVFATDDSPSARAAEAVLADSPVFGGLPIHVVSIADQSVDRSTPEIAVTNHGQMLDRKQVGFEATRLEHDRIAADAAVRLRAAGRDAEAQVRAGDAASEIIAVAEELRADLVVLGSRGRTGLSRIILGSVARNVLAGSRASVLIVREPLAISTEVRGKAVPIEDRAEPHDRQDRDHIGIDWNLGRPAHGINRPPPPKSTLSRDS